MDAQQDVASFLAETMSSRSKDRKCFACLHRPWLLWYSKKPGCLRLPVQACRSASYAMRSAACASMVVGQRGAAARLGSGGPDRSRVAQGAAA